jgi:transposase-like protein
MTGRPVRQRLLKDIEASGGWPAVLERIENGETITKIARSFNVSRGFFARLLHEDGGRSESVTRARKAAANALVEEAVEIVDSASPTRDELQHAKLRSDSRLWLASKLDREQYGDRGQVPVQVNIGELHLTALQAAARPGTDLLRPGPVMLPAKVEDVEQPTTTNTARHE